MSVCAYVWYKSYKFQATRSVGALWKVLVITLSCFIPIMVSPWERRQTPPHSSHSWSLKVRPLENLAEANFLKFSELSREGWERKAGVESKGFSSSWKAKKRRNKFKDADLIIQQNLIHNSANFQHACVFVHATAVQGELKTNNNKNIPIILLALRFLLASTL